MKKPLRIRPLLTHPNLVKAVASSPSQQDLDDPADNMLLTEMRRLDAEYSAQLSQTLTAGQYNRCQGESQQRMARYKYSTRR